MECCWRERRLEEGAADGWVDAHCDVADRYRAGGRDIVALFGLGSPLPEKERDIFFNFEFPITYTVRHPLSRDVVFFVQ